MADWEPALPPPLCEVPRAGDELWFSGEIHESNADDLAARTVAEIHAGIICLDLSAVRFFAAAGVRMMFTIRASATSLDGGVRVVCSPQVMRTPAGVPGWRPQRSAADRGLRDPLGR